MRFIYSYIIIFFLLPSCSINRQLGPFKPLCYKANITSETHYTEKDSIVASNMADFNTPNDKSLDIVQLIFSSNYEDVTNFKRVYIQDNKTYLFENGNLKNLPNKVATTLELSFTSHDTVNTVVTCKQRSSTRYYYRYFVKVNGKLTISISANQTPAEIDSTLIPRELYFIKLFENLR